MPWSATEVELEPGAVGVTGCGRRNVTTLKPHSDAAGTKAQLHRALVNNCTRRSHS